MKQIIEIEVPDGKEVVYDEYTKSIKFIDKKHSISKSWEEFVANHPNVVNEWYVDSASNIIRYNDSNNSKRNREGDKNLLAIKEDAEGILALIQLTRLRDEWIGDWTPDYLNISEDKYHIVILDNAIKVNKYTRTGALLSFPTKNLATEFMQCYIDLIIKAKRFI